MTREEAYKLLKYGMCLNREGYMVIRPGCQKEYFEAVDMGIAALRGPTREMDDEFGKYKKFKEYFDDLYGKGLEVENWHMNGETIPFDDFYESACEYAEL